MNVIVLVQFMLQTLCDRVHVHYFPLASVAMIVQFYTGITILQETMRFVCTVCTGTLNNGLVIQFSHYRNFWCTTNHNLDSTQEYSACIYYKPLAAITMPSYSNYALHAVE